MPMKREVGMAVALVVILTCVPAGAEHSVELEENGLHYYFSTPSDTYALWEYVPLTFVITNVSGDSLIIEHPCAGLGSMSIGIWAPPNGWHPEPWGVWECCGCFTVMSWDTLAAGGTYVKQGAWDMYDPLTERPIWWDGTYLLRATYSGWTWPDGPSLHQEFELEVEILPNETAVPESGWTGTWGMLKALYR